MMKKLLLLIAFAGLGLGFTAKAQTQIIDVNQPTPLYPGVCQCDTVEITYQIQNSDFPIGTSFVYEMTSDSTDWTNSDTLVLASFTAVTGNPPDPLDTITRGTKRARLGVPCDHPVGVSSIRVIASNGITSDTVHYQVQTRTKSEIDSINGGIPNPYTPADDWGFCDGDSIVLYAAPFGTFFQWKRNGADIPGETNDSLVVKMSGTYSVDTWVNASCKTTSADTVIEIFSPSPEITLQSPPAYQIDSLLPRDSVLFCEGGYVELKANDPPTGTATPITFSYRWITDTIDSFTGQPWYFYTDTSAVNKDTNQTVRIDTSLLSFENGMARVYSVITDNNGCTDTSAPYYIMYDTIPDAPIASIPFPGTGPVIPSFGDVCMKDSVLLSLVPSGIPTDLTRYRFQWERFFNGSWVNVPGAILPYLQVDTSMMPEDPPRALSYYRITVRTVTPSSASFIPPAQTVCSYTSDSIRVRWFPGYEVDLQPDPWVNVVGQDSINFCERDSARIIAPSSPLPFQLPYKYQWLTDSMDNNLGRRVYYPTDVNDTLQSLVIHESGRYYISIDDGICTDTSDAYFVFVDSIPNTDLTTVPFLGIPPKPSPLDICIYDSVQISATDTVLPGWEYQWQRLEEDVWEDLPGDTFPAIVVDTSYRPYYDTTYFRLTTSYRNRFGLTTCPDITDSIQVIFYPLPTVNFFPGDSLGVCIGDSVLVVEQGNGITYRWLDGPRGSSRWLSDPGTYTVEITGDNQCVRLAEVDIYPQSTTAEAGDDQTVNSGEVATLSGSGGVDYRWYANKPINFNDFLSQTIQVSKVLPDSVASDTVTIYLEATGSDGCRGVDSLQLIILNPLGREEVDLKNAYNLFTPNGDGRNDLWDIRKVIEGKGACEIMILNRWGSVVHEDESFNGTWDGNDQGGNPLPDGTYYYLLSCNGRVILKNAVTIIRND